MTTQYFVDGEGNYIGGFDGVEPPDGSIEIPSAPNDARQIWDGSAWGKIPITIPDRVTSRQFKLQLLATNLLNQVEAWVASQDQAVQISYNNSGTFVRTEPMMITGFQALGFTSDQIDAFFLAASEL